MKGLLGLVLAAALGLLGAACNWLYLQRAVRFGEQQSFIAIKSTVQLNVGDLIREDHIEKVDIPTNAVGNLNNVAPLWSAKDAVLGHRATRPYMGGEIILEMDLLTPVQQDLAATLQENEVARWVPIDPRSVIPEQINPGDLVSFEVTVTEVPPSTPPKLNVAPVQPENILGAEGSAPAPERLEPTTPSISTKTEIIGPFRVLALGDRRERRNVAVAARGRGGLENTITVLVRLNGNELEPKAARLFDALRNGGRTAAVQLHSAKAKEN
jgi:hypothetical protein